MSPFGIARDVPADWARSGERIGPERIAPEGMTPEGRIVPVGIAAAVRAIVAAFPFNDGDLISPLGMSSPRMEPFGIPDDRSLSCRIVIVTPSVTSRSPLQRPAHASPPASWPALS